MASRGCCQTPCPASPTCSGCGRVSVEYCRILASCVCATHFTDNSTDSGHSALRNFLSCPHLRMEARVGIERLASLYRPILSAFPKKSSLSASIVTDRFLSPWYSFWYSSRSAEMSIVPCNRLCRVLRRFLDVSEESLFFGIRNSALSGANPHDTFRSGSAPRNHSVCCSPCRPKWVARLARGNSK